jgi:hypothetical protein
MYLYDHQNEILLKKPSFSAIQNIRRQAVAYNEGYNLHLENNHDYHYGNIYFIGGLDVKRGT